MAEYFLKKSQVQTINNQYKWIMRLYIQFYSIASNLIHLMCLSNVVYLMSAGFIAFGDSKLQKSKEIITFSTATKEEFPICYVLFAWADMSGPFHIQTDFHQNLRRASQSQPLI